MSNDGFITLEELDRQMTAGMSPDEIAERDARMEAVNRDLDAYEDAWRKENGLPPREEATDADQMQ